MEITLNFPSLGRETGKGREGEGENWRVTDLPFSLSPFPPLKIYIYSD